MRMMFAIMIVAYKITVKYRIWQLRLWIMRGLSVLADVVGHGAIDPLLELI